MRSLPYDSILTLLHANPTSVHLHVGHADSAMPFDDALFVHRPTRLRRAHLLRLFGPRAPYVVDICFDRAAAPQVDRVRVGNLAHFEGGWLCMVWEGRVSLRVSVRVRMSGVSGVSVDADLLCCNRTIIRIFQLFIFLAISRLRRQNGKYMNK